MNEVNVYLKCHFEFKKKKKQGHYFFPSLKLTFPFLFNLYDVQSTLDFKSTSTKQILNKLRRFTIGEAKRWTWIDGFTLQFPISTRLTRQPPGKSNFLEYWNSSTQQNNWKLTVFNGVFRPKYCRSACHSLETPVFILFRAVSLSILTWDIALCNC